MTLTLDNLPPSIQNKTKEQKEAFIKAFNKALDKGVTQDEAMFAGLASVKLASKSILNSSNKKDFSTRKANNFKTTPKHLQQLLDVSEVANRSVLQEEVETQEVETVLKQRIKDTSILPIFLQKHSLNYGIDRNVVAMNFDTQGALVTVFDTGESIKTDAVAIQEYIQQTIGVFQNKKSDGGVTASNVLYNTFDLSGFSKTITALDHGLSAITSYYVLNNNTNSEVMLSFEIDNVTKDITISGVIPLDDFTLHLTGIKA